MELTLKMDNLEQLIKTSLEENLNNVIKEEIRVVISRLVQDSKTSIAEYINAKVLEIADEYISNATISVGGGWKEEPKTYTIEEYIKAEIADRIESGKFLVKSAYSSDTYKSFADFVTERFDVDTKIQKELTAFMDKVKKDINRNIEEMFNQTTQAALSSSIINLLMQNDTFINMQDSIKRIASR